MRTVKNQLQHVYEESLFTSFGPAQDLMLKARKFAENLNLLGISISFSEASVLRFLVHLSQCKKFVEIGTLTGFSALALLQGLSQDGELWTFEKNPEHAKLAKEILDSFISQSDQKIQVIVGDAETQLPSIEGSGPFDGIFIDGNKAAYGRYLNWAEKNIKQGGLIIADNVFLEGRVWGEKGEKFSDKQINVMKEFNLRLSDPNKYLFSLLPTSEGLIAARKLF